MRYRKRPIEIDASQWFKNGDHPDDGLPPANKTLVSYEPVS